jgi:hypothetical protein
MKTLNLKTLIRRPNLVEFPDLKPLVGENPFFVVLQIVVGPPHDVEG